MRAIDGDALKDWMKNNQTKEFNCVGTALILVAINSGRFDVKVGGDHEWKQDDVVERKDKK